MDSETPSVNGSVTYTPSAAAWKTSQSVSGHNGASYLHDKDEAKGEKRVRFTPSMSKAGFYRVALRWTAHKNRATNVPITIKHQGVTATRTVNQQQNGGRWVSLGVFSFASGNDGYVEVSTTDTNGYVIADAMRLSRTQFIMDSEAPGLNGKVERKGTWVRSHYIDDGYHGTAYIHDDNVGKGQKSIRFMPEIGDSATYQVEIRWTAFPNRATNVPIVIQHEGGLANQKVDQRKNGGKWVSLGEYNFTTGGENSVEIGTGGTDGHVIVDALRFTRK